jgi:hypothetical protein
MRVAATMAAVLVTAGVAACEPPSDLPNESAGGGTNNAAEPKIRMANKHHDDLARLEPQLQRLALMRAIRQTGNRCQRVDNAGYQQEYRNMRMWVGVCGVEEKSWAVFIAPNGDVQVRDCAQAGQLQLPRCEGLPPPVPVPDPFTNGAYRP